MKKSEVKIGSVYRVKVTGKVAQVRITGENPHGGWDGVNVATKRKVRIKSAQRLRGPSPQKTPTPARVANKSTKASKGSPKPRKAGTGEPRGPRATRPSGLDAAAKVLAEVGEPMSCKAMVERMLAQGLWQSQGKTPASTIYAAIIREIAAKGEAARFRKVERGKFELAK